MGEEIAALFDGRLHPMGMTTIPAVAQNAEIWTGSPTSVLSILRLEGLAVAAISAVLYARTGASWWLFAVLWLAPDLSMLGYLGRPCRASRIYNAAHTYLVPITLAVCALLLKAEALVPIALIWVNHIGVDRMMGYGLKYQTGFGWTHLGKLGRARG